MSKHKIVLDLALEYVILAVTFWYFSIPNSNVVAVLALALVAWLLLRAIFIALALTIFWYKRRQIMKGPFGYLLKLEELANKYPEVPICDYCGFHPPKWDGDNSNAVRHQPEEPHVYPNGYGFSHRKKQKDADV